MGGIVGFYPKGWRRQSWQHQPTNGQKYNVCGEGPIAGKLKRNNIGANDEQSIPRNITPVQLICSKLLTTFHINSMPKRMIILVLIAMDLPRYECNKFLTFKKQPPLATWDQPDQTEAHMASVQCVEATDEKAWSSDDG